MENRKPTSWNFGNSDSIQRPEKAHLGKEKKTIDLIRHQELLGRQRRYEEIDSDQDKFIERLAKIKDIVTTDTTSEQSSIFRGKHYYEIFTPICVAGGKYTQGDLFARMISQKSFVTPTEQTDPVISSSITQIPILGSVKHTVDEANYTVTNTTLPGHLLHPGSAQHQIVQRGNEIGVLTKGTGHGLLPRLNEFLAPYVWARPNNTLKEAFKDEKL